MEVVVAPRRKEDDSASAVAQPQHWWWAGSMAIFVVNTVLLVAYHVGVSPTGDPLLLSPLNKLLFGVLVLMAFELLDFCTKNSGSTYCILHCSLTVCAIFQRRLCS
jgi:hypothetical protein